MCNYLDIYIYVCSTMHLRKLLCVIHHMCVCVCLVPLHGTFASFKHVPFVVVVDVLERGFDDDP